MQTPRVNEIIVLEHSKCQIPHNYIDSTFNTMPKTEANDVSTFSTVLNDATELCMNLNQLLFSLVWRFKQLNG